MLQVYQLLCVIPIFLYIYYDHFGLSQAALDWKPTLHIDNDGRVICQHPELGKFVVKVLNKEKCLILWTCNRGHKYSSQRKTSEI